MKSIKILLPAAMTFALFMGTNALHAQSASTSSTDNQMVKIVSELIPKKAIGLDYTQSLVEINEALTKGVKSDHNVDFQGKIMVHIALDTNGTVQTVSFDKNISAKLSAAIATTLKAAPVTPVLLNGRAKAQTFNIPLIIK